MAHIWNGQGRGREALELMKQCMEVRVKCLGVNHPDTTSIEAVHPLVAERDLEISDTDNKSLTSIEID